MKLSLLFFELPEDLQDRIAARMDYFVRRFPTMRPTVSLL
jgi:hypothetical protein